MQSKTEKVFSNLAWSYAERFLAQCITLLVSIILARILEPSHYGLISIVTVFITIGDALVMGGFGNALIQKKDASEIDFNSICWLSLGVAGLLYVILFFSSYIIANFYNNNILVPVIRIMGLKFLFSAVNSVQHAYVQKKMIFKQFFFATLGGTIASAFIGVTLALRGYGVWALVVQYLSNTIIDTLILGLIISWKPKFQISFESIKSLWGFGSKILASTIVFTIKDNIRSLIIGKKFTPSDLAYYNQGNRFPQLLVTDIVESLGKVMFPVFSKNQDNLDDLKGYMRKSIRLSSYVLTPAVVGLMAVGDTFICLILTDKWIASSLYLRILCLAYATRSVSTILQKGLLAIGKSNVNLLHECVTSSMTIILLLMAVLAFNSVEFIAWSYVIIMLIGVTIYAYYAKKYINYSYIELIKDYFPSLAMSIIMGVFIYLFGMIRIHLFLKLCCQIILGIGIYVFLSVVLLNEEFIYLFDFFKKNIKYWR